MRRPPTPERTGLPARSLARAATACKGFDKLSPNGERMATTEQTGLSGRRLAAAETGRARKGFDRLSPNGGSDGVDTLGSHAQRATPEVASR